MTWFLIPGSSVNQKLFRSLTKYGDLRGFVPFVQFKKHENTHGVVLLLVSCWLKPVTLLKVTLLYGCFSYFSNSANGIKLHKASQIIAFIEEGDYVFNKA